MAIIIEKYILYGASFNPPHMGHYSAISQMLEDYDKVVVFPYPKKYGSEYDENLPSISQRMKMLSIFFGEFFPQIQQRLILVNLASEMKKDKVTVGFPHTYDYLQYAKSRIPEGSDLSVCLGFDTNNESRKEHFYKEEEIKQSFDVFRIEEDNTIKSSELRKFFSSHKNLKNAKDELYIRYAVGNELAEHIFKNNLYGVQKKKQELDSSTILLPDNKIKKPKMK